MLSTEILIEFIFDFLFQSVCDSKVCMVIVDLRFMTHVCRNIDSVWSEVDEIRSRAINQHLDTKVGSGA